MRKSAFLSAAIGLFAAAGLAAPASVGVPTTPKALATARQPRGSSIREWFGGREGDGLGWRARRLSRGWTNRHAQRVAAKKRAVVRHRARSRGHA